MSTPRKRFRGVSCAIGHNVCLVVSQSGVPWYSVGGAEKPIHGIRPFASCVPVLPRAMHTHGIRIHVPDTSGFLPITSWSAPETAMFPTPPTPQLHTACRLTAQGLSTVCRAMLHNVTNRTYNTNGIVRRQHRQRDQFGRCTLTTRHERWLNMSESEYRGTNTNETVHKAVSDSHQSAYTHTHGGGSEANAGRAASNGTSRLDSAGETRN